MIKYKIVKGEVDSSFDTESLEYQVNNALHYGWKLFGPPFFAGKYAVQAMYTGEYDAGPSQENSAKPATDRR